MSCAFVYPGQGSQSVGMLGDVIHQAVVKQTFEEASTALGFDLAKLCLEGPEETLGATQNTQPALLTASVAMYRLWSERSAVRPEVMAGHSLGEYSALVCAGALPFAAAVELVAFRGKAMQDAVPAGSGAMAAVLGLDDEVVIAACDEAAQGEVAAAVNFNAPGQVVIAGNSAAIERAGAICKEKGAKRVLPLAVSAPSHCALMKPAADQLAQKLTDIDIATPAIPVIHNVDVHSHQDAASIREALVTQLYHPVRWVETVRALAAQGVDRAIECGPGKVLAGLNKRIERDMTVFPIFDQASLDKAVEECQ